MRTLVNVYKVSKNAKVFFTLHQAYEFVFGKLREREREREIKSKTQIVYDEYLHKHLMKVLLLEIFRMAHFTSV